MCFCVCVHCMYHGWQSTFHGCGNCCCWHNSALWFRSDFCCCILFTLSQFIDAWAFLFSSVRKLFAHGQCHNRNRSCQLATLELHCRKLKQATNKRVERGQGQLGRQDSICSGFNWISKLLFISWQQDLRPCPGIFRMLRHAPSTQLSLVLLAIKAVSQLS